MTESTPGPIDATRLRRFARPAKWGAGVLVAVAALGFGVVPPVARHYAVQILGETLGREVAIDGVRFNPFTLSVDVLGARIMEADGAQPALAFERLHANLELESLLRGGPVLREAELHGLRLHVVRLPEGRHNWSDVVERLNAPSTNEAEESADTDEKGAPLRFSVGNIRLTNGTVTIADTVRNTRHELSEIALGVPFVSNLPVKVEVNVEPALSAKIDGHPLELKGRSKPFTEARDTALDLSLKDFEIAPWLAYLPFEPAFSVPSGLLGADIELSFSQPEGAPPVVAVRGQVQVNELVVKDKADQPAIAIGEFGIELADVQPLIGRYQFSKLRLLQPEIDLVRLADGKLNLLGLLPPQSPAQNNARKPDGKRKAKAAGAKNGADGGAPAAIDFLLAQARIRDGVVRFEDRSVPGPFRTRVEQINLDLRDLATVADMPAEIRLDYVTDTGFKASHQDTLKLHPFEFSGALNFEQLEPARFAPYYAAALPGGEIRGGRADGALHYRVTLDGEVPRIEVGADRFALNGFALGLKGQKGDALSAQALTVADAVVQLAERRIKVGEVALKGAKVAAVRQKNGELDLLGMLAADSGKTSDGPPWSVAVGKLALDAAAIRVEDRSAGKPVVFAAEGIELDVADFSTDKGKATRLELDSLINKSGRLGAKGTVTLDPLATDLQLEVKDVDLLPLQPYVLEQTRVAIARGRLSTEGKLALATARDGKLALRYSGDLAVADFDSIDRVNDTGFVRWRGLRVSDVDLRTEPFALDIRSIALNNFYTRLILDEQGRLNLREVQGTEQGGQADAEREVLHTASGEAETTLPPAKTAPPPIRIGTIAVKGGNVAFSDRFVRPNYDANLTDLEGELRGLSSDPTTLAKLNLAGRVDKTAPLTVAGEFNPFRDDRHLDIAAAVKGFELTGLSSYSGKYVGYGIQKGTLSADLNYRIEDRKLTATNKIFLDQLTFGDAVDSPDAVNLPVQLAVSLLKNSRGEISIDLPVSGTLDDPEFSVFGLVVRALFNLVGKAATAPFALLGSALGGGEEMSHLEFAPGQAAPAAEQTAKLEALAAALVDRPALRLDITGFADLATDLEGLRRARLDAAVRQVKLRELGKRGEVVPPVEEVEVGAEEYPALLEAVYDDADIKKPRNFIGLAKSLPVAEMEALLLPAMKVGEADVKALAQRRAQEVRSWLAESGKVPAERLFLVAPSADAPAAREVRFTLR